MPRAEAEIGECSKEKNQQNGRRKANSPAEQAPKQKISRKAETEIDNRESSGEEDEMVSPTPTERQTGRAGKASSPTPLSHYTERAGGDLVVEGAANRAHWCIDAHEPSVSTVVITDSNGRSWNKAEYPIDATWCVYSFGGCHLNDVENLLCDTHSDRLKHVSKIVICVGVNDRAADNRSTLSSLRKIKAWGERSGNALFFMGIPPFPDVLPTEITNISIINRQARDIFEQGYIEPIDEECLMLQQYTNIHYTSDTAHFVMGRLAHHLN